MVVTENVPSGASIRLDQVTVRYPEQVALDRVDMHVGPGEAVALVGPSGAGKTTLLRVMGAAISPADGSVWFDGVDLARIDRARLRRIRAATGFVHQDLRLVPNLRVSQNVLAGRLGRQSLVRSIREMLIPARASLEIVHALLERVGIAEKLFERTDRLSGGQQQRVAIARALYQEPRVLLADEPVSSVDPARAQNALELLAGIATERGITLVSSLHNLDLARALFPRLVGVRDGRVCFDRPTGEVDDREFEALYRLEGANDEPHR